MTQLPRRVSDAQRPLQRLQGRRRNRRRRLRRGRGDARTVRERQRPRLGVRGGPRRLGATIRRSRPNLVGGHRPGRRHRDEPRFSSAGRGLLARRPRPAPRRVRGPLRASPKRDLHNIPSFRRRPESRGAQAPNAAGEGTLGGGGSYARPLTRRRLMRFGATKTRGWLGAGAALLIALALAACSREPAPPTPTPTATLPPTLAPTATLAPAPPPTPTLAPTATLPPMPAPTATATLAPPPTARPTPQSASRPSVPTRPSVPARPAPTPTQAPTRPPPTATATLAPTATPTPAPPTPTPTAAPTHTPTPAPSAVWRADLPVGSRPGDRAPDAALTLANGSSSTIEEAAAGRSVLLYFFATW